MFQIGDTVEITKIDKNFGLSKIQGTILAISYHEELERSRKYYYITYKTTNQFIRLGRGSSGSVKFYVSSPRPIYAANVTLVKKATKVNPKPFATIRQGDKRFDLMS